MFETPNGSFLPSAWSPDPHHAHKALHGLALSTFQLHLAMVALSFFRSMASTSPVSYTVLHPPTRAFAKAGFPGIAEISPLAFLLPEFNSDLPASFGHHSLLFHLFSSSSLILPFHLLVGFFSLPIVPQRSTINSWSLPLTPHLPILSS